MNDVGCPFCLESGFDLTGLKMHLISHCDKYDKTPVMHYHQAKYVDGKLVDQCNDCGLDIRDSIHYREHFSMIVASMKARCTSCRRVYTPSEREIDEARSFGCLMSACCYAPATVEQVTAKEPKQHARRAKKEKG